MNVHRYLLNDISDTNLTVEVTGKNVGQCLTDLIRKYPKLKEAVFEESGELRYELFAFVNGHNSLPDQLNQRVQNGDRIDLIPLRMMGSGG